MSRFNRRDLNDNPFFVIFAFVLLAVFLFLYLYMKVDAYNGDVSCLFIKCVKVIR